MLMNILATMSSVNVILNISKGVHHHHASYIWTAGWTSWTCLSGDVLLLQISVLLTYYRQLAQQEKSEKEKKKFSRRRSYHYLSVRFGWYECNSTKYSWL